MFRWLNAKRGQNTAEYAILIGVIVAAAIAMQVYVRRGMQARIKDGVDYMQTAENTTLFSGADQYEPYYLSSNYTTTQNGSSSEYMTSDGSITRNMEGMTTQRSGNQSYSAYNETE